MGTPEPHTGAWPAEVWLAGEEPMQEAQAEPARGDVMDKLEDLKEKIGPRVEEIRETLEPKLEKVKGRFGQTLGKISEKLIRKKF